MHCDAQLVAPLYQHFLLSKLGQTDFDLQWSEFISGLCVQDDRCLRVAVMICDTLVNTQTRTHTALTGYTISSASWATNRYVDAISAAVESWWRCINWFCHAPHAPMARCRSLGTVCLARATFYVNKKCQKPKNARMALRSYSSRQVNLDSGDPSVQFYLRCW